MNYQPVLQNPCIPKAGGAVECVEEVLHVVGHMEAVAGRSTLSRMGFTLNSLGDLIDELGTRGEVAVLAQIRILGAHDGELCTPPLLELRVNALVHYPCLIPSLSLSSYAAWRLHGGYTAVTWALHGGYTAAT